VPDARIGGDSIPQPFLVCLPRHKYINVTLTHRTSLGPRVQSDPHMYGAGQLVTVADLSVCRIFLNYGSLFSLETDIFAFYMLLLESALANLDQSTVCSTLGCGKSVGDEIGIVFDHRF
jgi:hypothetical protein